MLWSQPKKIHLLTSLITTCLTLALQLRFIDGATQIYPDDAAGENCKNKRSSLKAYNAEGEYCEGSKYDYWSTWMKYGGHADDMASLESGEADAINAALKRCTNTRSIHPPSESGHADETWIDWLNSQGVVRHEMEREEFVVLESPFALEKGLSNDLRATFDSATSMVYPVPVPVWLDAYMEGTQQYWLGCKAALDPETFADADMMQKLNETLNLWPHEKPCDDQIILITGTGKSGSLVIICLVLVIVIGLSIFAALLYRKLQEDRGRGAGETNARQVEMSAAINKSDDVEKAPLADRSSHKW